MSRSAGRSVRIISRTSALALWQAEFVKHQLQQLHPALHITIQGIKTEGDKILDVPLQKVGGKGLFVKELEVALLNHQADLAVHSMKDMPADLPEGLTLSAILPRGDVRDAFISNQAKSYKTLASGARIGTSSLRRQAQLAAVRPDLTYCSLRGNVDTRLIRLDKGSFDGIILAVAGLQRLGLSDRISEYLDTELMLPGVGQGALGIETRVDDNEIQALLAGLHHPATAVCVFAERSLNAALGGNCQSPIAALAVLKAAKLYLQGWVGSLDGQRMVKAKAIGYPRHPTELGKKVAAQLIKLGALDIMKTP